MGEVEEFNADIFEPESIFERDHVQNGKKGKGLVPTLDLKAVNASTSPSSSKRGKPPLHPQSGRSNSTDLNNLQSLESLENLLDNDNFHEMK